MAADKYNHMKDLFSIQERVNRLFEDVLGKESGDTAFRKSWSPLVDIYETENEFVVIAELPEVRQEDVDIRVENNVLLLQGERKFNRDKAKDSFHRVERKYGFFKRSFLLPSSVDQGSIQANLKDGILRIVLPKRAEAEPLRVDIE